MKWILAVAAWLACVSCGAGLAYVLGAVGVPGAFLSALGFLTGGSGFVVAIIVFDRAER